MNDIKVSIAVIIIFICHIASIIIVSKTQKTTLLIPYLNAFIVVGLLVYWTIKSLKIKQHNFEFSELFIIGLETCILIFALSSIIGFHNKIYIKVINFIGFGIHLLATAGMLYYMLTFKFNKLF